MKTILITLAIVVGLSLTIVVSGLLYMEFHPRVTDPYID